jgi:predicted RNase H-like HicB family nuclease
MMGMTEYAVIIEKAQDGSFSAYVPDLPGCVACGDTDAEVEALIAEAIELHIESLRYHNEPVPPPTTQVVTVVLDDTSASTAAQGPTASQLTLDDADEFVSFPDLDESHALAARVHGDSMSPKYGDADIVLFSPERAMRDGDDCFVRLKDGTTTFKQVFHATDENNRPSFRLQPRNQKYPAQTVPADEVEACYPAVFKYASVANEPLEKVEQVPFRRLRKPRRIRRWETLNQE